MNTEKSTHLQLTTTALDALYEKNKWTFSDLGYKDHEIGSGARSVNFSAIEPAWLRELLKQTIWRKRNNVSTSTLAAYLRTFRVFSKFWLSMNQEPSLKELNVEVIDNFFYSIHDKSNSTRASYHSILNEAFNCWKDWGELPESLRIINREMKPRTDRWKANKIKYLDAKAQQVLLKGISPPKNYLERLVHVLYETGARCNEILNLADDCLSSDDSGSYLTRGNLKFYKPHTVPISNEVAGYVKEQINCSKQYSEKLGVPNENRLIFVHPRNGHIKKYSLSQINSRLKQLSEKLNITDKFGKPINLSTHMFRHTVGTNLINNGVAQYHVQKFLGHESSEMTAIYAQLHDKTLRKSIGIASQKLVDIKGNLYESANFIADIIEYESDVCLEAKWLKKNIATQSLPNGLCSLPIRQVCPHANACLSCPSFRTDESFIDIHIAHLKRAEQIITNAKGKGLIRQAQLNEEIAKNLTIIIGTINGE